MFLKYMTKNKQTNKAPLFKYIQPIAFISNGTLGEKELRARVTPDLPISTIIQDFRWVE